MIFCKISRRSVPGSCLIHFSLVFLIIPKFPITTVMTIAGMFHTQFISVSKSLYLDNFSTSFRAEISFLQQAFDWWSSTTTSGLLAYSSLSVEAGVFPKLLLYSICGCIFSLQGCGNQTLYAQQFLQTCNKDDTLDWLDLWWFYTYMI